jgi:hypothetical protein
VGLFLLWLVFSSAAFVKVRASSYFGFTAFLGGAAVATLAILVTGLKRERARRIEAVLVDPDFPILAWDEDILDRRPVIENLLRTILFDQPSVVALMGSYGTGKTSVFNLLQNELEKESAVLIVRFSSWLPGSQEALVVSLFNSVVRAYSGKLLAPHFKGTLIRYARLLGGLIPRVGGAVKDLLREPPQFQQFENLKKEIQALPLRVVVFLDDVDRMQKDELESLLKLIRGASEFPNLTYLCALDYQAVGRRLFGSSVQENEAREYLEKFFPVKLALPLIDPSVLAREFDKRFEKLCLTHGLLETEEEQKEFNEEFQPLWGDHVRNNLNNLRRLKLYFNRIASSISPITQEVNLFDFMILELIRDNAPEIYEAIYRNPGFFYFARWALETWGETIAVDEQKEAARRKEFIESALASTALDADGRKLIEELLCRLFPLAADALGRGGFPLVHRSESKCEEERRICHPRYFPRYFVFGVPSTQFGEREFQQFVSGISELKSVEEARTKFESTFASIENPLKRWHFLDRVVRGIDKFSGTQSQGLAEGVAFVSGKLGEAFLGLGEWDRARVLVFSAANKVGNSPQIQQLLERVIRLAVSDGFSADILFYSVNKERNKIVGDWSQVDTAALKNCFRERMVQKYHPGSSASILASEAHHALRALFSWASLGGDAEKEVRDFLRFEIQRKPQLLGKLMGWFYGQEMAVANETLSSLSKLLPIEEVEAMLEKYGGQAYSSHEERAAIERFKAARRPGTAEAAQKFMDTADQ